MLWFCGQDKEYATFPGAPSSSFSCCFCEQQLLLNRRFVTFEKNSPPPKKIRMCVFFLLHIHAFIYSSNHSIKWVSSQSFIHSLIHSVLKSVQKQIIHSVSPVDHHSLSPVVNHSILQLFTQSFIQSPRYNSRCTGKCLMQLKWIVLIYYCNHQPKEGKPSPTLERWLSNLVEIFWTFRREPSVRNWILGESPLWYHQWLGLIADGYLF